MIYPYFQPHEKPFGQTFGWWTTKWWQWFLSKSYNINPAIDQTGRNNAIDQNQKDVWFLAGTFDTMIDVAFRKVQIPSNRSILLPAICYQANYIEDPLFTNEKELLCHVKDDINDIIEHLVTIDGVSIGTFRILSDPVIFPIKLAKDIPHGQHSHLMQALHQDVDTYAVSDGYWAFIKPLPVGNYELHLLGSCGKGIRRTEAYYKIEVTI